MLKPRIGILINWVGAQHLWLWPLKTIIWNINNFQQRNLQKNGRRYESLATAAKIQRSLLQEALLLTLGFVFFAVVCK